MREDLKRVNDKVANLVLLDLFTYDETLSSCLKYGDELVLKLALECKDELLTQMNEQGAGYTDRHGI